MTGAGGVGGPDLNPHWLAKGLAGLILGFAIGLGLSGLLARTGPGGVEAAYKYMVAMWAVAPVWMLVFALSFLFRSGPRAWLWLGTAALAVHGALLASRLWL
ncbi:MAG TPA: hypothetical protein VGO55_13755 [Allosphingosinicella sp.]|jgi:hypothetical protein|nr:hypothetical protein [Allosphingosinicella sp.]